MMVFLIKIETVTVLNIQMKISKDGRRVKILVTTSKDLFNQFEV